MPRKSRAKVLVVEPSVAERYAVAGRIDGRVEEALIERDLFADMTLRRATALAMLESGETSETILEATGLTKTQLARVRNGTVEVPRDVVERLKDAEGRKLTLVTHRLLDTILEASEDELKKIPLNQRMIALGISIDKRELLEGRPTSRTETIRTAQDEVLEEELRQLQRELDAIEVDFEPA